MKSPGALIPPGLKNRIENWLPDSMLSPGSRNDETG